MRERKNKFHPCRMDLRILASLLENGHASAEHIKSIAEMLRRIGDGEDIDSILGVKRKPYRPQSYRLEKIVWDVMSYRYPFDERTKSLKLNDAIDAVAEIHKITAETVREYYKSKRGKELRNKFKSNISYPD
jgi:hypothetical protein